MSVEKRPQEAAQRIAKIAAHAAQLGMTPNDLLRKAGVPPQYYKRWQQNASCPNMETVEKILGVRE